MEIDEHLERTLYTPSPDTNKVYNSIPHHERENPKSLAEHQVHSYLTLLRQTTSSNAFHSRVCILLGLDCQESKFLYSSLYPVTFACLHFCLLLDGGSVNVIYSTPQNVKNTNFAANTPIYLNIKLHTRTLDRRLFTK
jgi:hypothetical protein